MNSRSPTPARDAILAGDRQAIARAITQVENAAPAAARLLAQIAPERGRAHVIGITGAPGAGKSTLIDALLGAWLAAGCRVAVVAIDPSSPITGGAVLGDRVRMGRHGHHENCFIRSLAARGELGGLSRATAGAVDLLDAAGFDPIIVETVGTGQSEVDIAKLADTRVVVCPPGLGDEVQALKAGILEIADILVVSKGDTPLAQATERDLREMLGARPRSAPQVTVQRVCAPSGDGIAALVAEIDAHATRAGRGRRLAQVDDPAETGAAAVVRRLAGRDALAQLLGIELVDGGAGHATVAMTIGPTHLNFHGSCHGGSIFSLADAAFGLASNSHGTVAAGIDVHITYNVAVKPGERLIARAKEASRNRKLAVYRIDVERDDGTLVACFTGTVFVTSRPIGER